MRVAADFRAAQATLHSRLSCNLGGNKRIAALEEVQRDGTVKEVPKHFKSDFHPHVVIQTKNLDRLFYLGSRRGVQSRSGANIEVG